MNILGIGISSINLSLAIEQLGQLIEGRAHAYVVVCPVYSIMLCQYDPDYRAIVNQADLVTPDGMPLVFLARWMGYSDVDRVYGPDLMLALSSLSAQMGYTQFYYGGGEGVAPQLAEVLKKRFPGLAVVGTYTPPFRALSADEDDEIVQRINDADPDVVWIGLGSPKQDAWMAAHRKRLNARVLIGVGAAFDIHTGRIPQAPRWMQRSALEWLFRLLTEPRRLWRRYLIYNPIFVFLIILQVLGIRHYTID